jgi:hypothetical protein
MNSSFATVVGVLALAVPAFGQAGVLYKVEPAAAFRQDHCLGPCLCVHNFETGPMSGTFTLTFDRPGPVFTHYTVSGVNWTGVIGGREVTFQGEGTYVTNGPTQDMQLALMTSSPVTLVPHPYASGLSVSQQAFPRIGITIQAAVQVCDQNTVQLVAAPVPCQADCDASGALTGNDFACFLNKYFAGDMYANCDANTGLVRLTALDFLCYMNRYAAGCP